MRSPVQSDPHVAPKADTAAEVGFDSAFFRSHTGRRVIEITGHEGKPHKYTFPTFFTGSRVTAMMFTADHARARQLLGGVPLFPVRMSPGRCLFLVACFRYGQVSDGMRGYNEVALGFAVSRSRIPLLPVLARAIWPSFGYFVVDLPVDSEENRVRGVEIWGLPKTMKEFAEDDGPNGREVRMSSGGETCLRVRIPRGGRERLVNESSRAYSVKGGVLYRTTTHQHGVAREYGSRAAEAGRVELKFGPMKPYSDFATLDLSDRPVKVRDFDSLSTALYWPEPYLRVV